MNIIKSFIIAFSMYSKIPMLNVEWDEKSMKYAICFFPVIGIVIGMVFFAVYYLCGIFNVGDVLRAALMTAVPVFISGGIHIDGFLDTTDALSSYAGKEKKLEILKDPHTGAFAIIGGCMYFLLFFAFLTEVDSNAAVISIGIGFILSRALSGLGVGIFKCAKNSGLLHTFKSASHRKAVVISMFFYILLCMVALCFMGVYGIAVIIASWLSFLWYRYISYKQFGGITGDIAGYFVCISELLCVAAGGLLCVLL